MKEKIERVDIKAIKEPSFIKALGYKSLTVLCHDIRNEIIDVVSKHGGHLSSNLGVVELTVALHRNFDFPKDKLIFDVSHQCYAHKILTGRSLENLNAKDSTSGFIRPDESEYDAFGAGHSSTSLSVAEGFANVRDLKKEDNYIVALIGDSSLVNGLSFEALNHIGGRFKKFIIVVNDNDMSISRPVGSVGKFFRGISTAKSYNKFKSGYRKLLYSNAPGRAIYRFSKAVKERIKRTLVPLTLFDGLGYTYMGPFNGHDIKALDKAFKHAKNSTKSVVLHVVTQKGKGYAPAENDKTGYWHGATPFNKETGEPLNIHPTTVSWPHIVGDFVKEEMGKHEESVLICPAMIKGSHLEGAFEAYPDRCIDVGIAEEHALTMAGATFAAGYHPIVCLYSTFLQRAYDELLHDCARNKADLTLLIDRAGLVGKDGDTHMGIYDEAYLKSIPDINLYMPTTFDELKSLMDMSMTKGSGIVAIRYPHTLMPKQDSYNEVEIKPWNVLEKGDSKEAVIAVGPKGAELLKMLKENGYKGSLIKALRLLPVDEKDIKSLLGYEKVTVYDSYGTKNGFAEAVASSLLENGYKGEFKSFAIPNTFVQHSTIAEQEKEYGVDVDSVLKEIL